MKKKVIVIIVAFLAFAYIVGSKANEKIYSADISNEKQSSEQQTGAPVEISPTQPLATDISDASIKANALSDEEIITAVENADISTKYSSLHVQKEDLKMIYPDMLTAVVENNSSDTIKNFEIAFLAFDENGYPVKIKSQYDFTNGGYEYVGTADDVNILVGDTYGDGTGWAVDESTGNQIGYVLACVKTAELYNEETWRNPYYSDWKAAFKNKPLPEFLK